MSDVSRQVTAEHAETVLRQLVAWQAARDPAALIVLTGIEGGAVRAAGALMAVRQDGSVAGYMSGGCIDADLILQAQSAIECGAPKQIRYGAGSPFVDLPLPCGGALILTILPTPNPHVLEQALDALRQRQSVSLMLGSDNGLNLGPPRQSGAVPDGGFSALLEPKPRLRIAGRGAEGVIINISSISRAGNFGQSNYAAAKAGVAAMTVTWAKELARHGIRVASIAPGFINTEMVAAMKESAREKLTSGIPLQRMGEPDEIARTVEFIFLNDYISGRCFDIDGGLRL